MAYKNTLQKIWLRVELTALRTTMTILYPSGAGMPLIYHHLLAPVMLHEKIGSYFRSDMHLICRIDITERPETNVYWLQELLPRVRCQRPMSFNSVSCSRNFAPISESPNDTSL